MLSPRFEEEQLAATLGQALAERHRKAEEAYAELQAFETAKRIAAEADEAARRALQEVWAHAR